MAVSPADFARLEGKVDRLLDIAEQSLAKDQLDEATNRVIGMSILAVLIGIGILAAVPKSVLRGAPSIEAVGGVALGLFALAEGIRRFLPDDYDVVLALAVPVMFVPLSVATGLLWFASHLAALEAAGLAVLLAAYCGRSLTDRERLATRIRLNGPLGPRRRWLQKWLRTHPRIDTLSELLAMVVSCGLVLAFLLPACYFLAHAHTLQVEPAWAVAIALIMLMVTLATATLWRLRRPLELKPMGNIV